MKSIIKKCTYLLGIVAVISASSCKKSEVIPLETDIDLEFYTQNLPFEIGNVFRPTIPDYEQKITDFGGVGDGITNNTKAFNDAMKALGKVGGGHLIVPHGIWVTGPIVFESNVDLHLIDGAVIYFTGDFDDYPIVDCYFEGLKTRRCQSPLSAKGKKNISITGFGTIDGHGDAWRWIRRSKLTESQWKDGLASGGVVGVINGSEIWAPTQPILDALAQANMNVVQFDNEEDWHKYRDFLRPVLLDFDSCENVLIEQVCFQNSPAWCLHPFRCRNVIINNILVVNPWFSQNGDGLDLEASKDVLILNSKFDVGDDAICLKSGKDKDGRELNSPCQNVIVDGCSVYHGHGGFVVGSEMSSSVQNICVKNSTFLGTDVGLRFKSKRGRGGCVGNIYIDNINMIGIETDCILFDLNYSGLSASEERALHIKKDVSMENIPPVDETTPQFKDIYINDVTCKGCERAMYFNGIPEMPITNINIKNATITAEIGLSVNHSEDITIDNVQLTLPEGEPEWSTYNVKNLVVNGDTIK
ncbi:MAG: glycoside hydrolase family 28 protein [Bacteroidales bacterium]|nr:glycoside hydrolase family 28 protein [Bacteroidales bacterium]